MEGIITDDDSRNATIFQAVRAITRHFIRGLGIGGLSIIASLGLADRVSATYLHLDCSPANAECYKTSQTLDYDRWYSSFNAGDYLDKEWYHLLDDWQYYYLDRGQYNLLGGLSYLLGHPCYPKLYERDWDQVIGFANRVSTGWFSLCTGQIPISEYDVCCCYFNTGDYIDRRQYYYLDKGQYYYLDRGQYNLLGGLGYSFGRPHYQKRLDICAIPEPSTIGFLGLGALGILGTQRVFFRCFGQI